MNVLEVPNGSLEEGMRHGRIARLAGFLLATIVAVTIGGAGCKVSRDPDTRPRLNPSAARLSPPPDLSIRGVRVAQLLDVLNPTFDLDLILAYVPLTESGTCTIGDQKLKVQGDSEENSVKYCNGDRTILVTEAVHRFMDGAPPVAVWFEFGYQVALSYLDRSRTPPAALYDNPNKRICAGGYIAARSNGFNNDPVGAVAAIVAYNQMGAQAQAFLKAGVTAAREAKPITACAGR